MQRAICCWIFTPALPEHPAASVRDYCSGAYTPFHAGASSTTMAGYVSATLAGNLSAIDDGRFSILDYRWLAYVNHDFTRIHHARGSSSRLIRNDADLHNVKP